MRSLKLIVCIKRVPNFGGWSSYPRLRVSSDGRSLDTKDMEFVMSSCDEVALEEALTLRESRGGEVVALSLGPGESQDQLLKCLALGADRAILLEDPEWSTRDCRARARALADGIRGLGADIVLTGSVSDDHGSSAVGAMIATYLGWACVTEVIELTLKEDGGIARRGHRGEVGTEAVSFHLPVVVTCGEDLNKPRYTSLKGILEAKKRSLEVFLSPTLPPAASLELLELRRQHLGRRCRLLSGKDAVSGLVRALRLDAQVLSRD